MADKDDGCFKRISRERGTAVNTSTILLAAVPSPYGLDSPFR
jgi:hypothetical protein